MAAPEPPWKAVTSRMALVTLGIVIAIEFPCTVLVYVGCAHRLTLWEKPLCLLPAYGLAAGTAAYCLYRQRRPT